MGLLIRRIVAALFIGTFLATSSLAMQGDRRFPAKEILACARPDSNNLESWLREAQELIAGMAVADVELVHVDLSQLSPEQLLEKIKKIHIASSSLVAGHMGKKAGEYRTGTMLAYGMKSKFGRYSIFSGEDLKAIHDNLREDDRTVAKNFWAWVVKAVTPESMAEHGSVDLYEHFALMFNEGHFTPDELEACNKVISLYALPRDIERKMQILATHLCDLFASPSYDPIKTASVALWGILSIHPFYDGNGRTARFVMNAILLNAGLPAVMVDADRAQYIDLAAEAFDKSCPLIFERYMRSLIKIDERPVSNVDYLEPRDKAALACASKYWNELYGKR